MSSSISLGASSSLEQLMDRFVDGDDGAFNQLYERVAPNLLAKLIGRSKDAEQARDVVQTTFLKVFRAKESYQKGSPVLPWIQVIAKRTLIDEQRPLGARREVLSNDGSLPEDDKGLSAAGQADELYGIRQAFEQLPPQYRDAIGLTKVSGLSGGEAARQLKTTSAAIKQRVHRGYQILRTLLDPIGDAGTATA